MTTEPEYPEGVAYGNRDVPSAALSEGVSVEILYFKRCTDGAVFVSRNDVVDFLISAGHLEAADTIRECGREWDGIQ